MKLGLLVGSGAAFDDALRLLDHEPAGQQKVLAGPRDSVTLATGAAAVTSVNRPHQCVVHQPAPLHAKPFDYYKTAFGLFRHDPTHWSTGLNLLPRASNPASGRG